MKTYYTYILANADRSKLYIGITNNMIRRIGEHKLNQSIHSRRYQIHRLVYMRRFYDVRRAIAYEKKLKNGNRNRKLWLIDSTNPTWFDLSRLLQSPGIENYFKHPWTVDSPHLKL